MSNCPKCGKLLIEDIDGELKEKYYFCINYPTCDYFTYDTSNTEDVHRNYNYE